MRGSRTMTDTRRSNKYFTRSNGTLFACRSSANGTRNARQTARSADVWLRTRRDRPPLVTTHTHTPSGRSTHEAIRTYVSSSPTPEKRTLKPRRKRFIRHGSRNLRFEKIFRVPVVDYDDDDDKSDGFTTPKQTPCMSMEFEYVFWNFCLDATRPALQLRR